LPNTILWNPRRGARTANHEAPAVGLAEYVRSDAGASSGRVLFNETLNSREPGTHRDASGLNHLVKAGVLPERGVLDPGVGGDHRDECRAAAEDLVSTRTIAPMVEA